MSMPLPLKSRIIEDYLMKIPLEYDILDIKRIIKACDREYLEINAKSIKDKMK